MIGCGMIAETHARSIGQLAEAELVAVYDYAKEKAVRFAEAYPADVCDSMEELLVRGDIDAVCICTPSGLHAEQTVMAANKGKHVLVEKPAAIRLADLDRMIRACEENGVWLATVFPRRMGPQARYARQLIQEGKLGRLSLCSAYVKIYRDAQYYQSAGWRATWDLDGGGAMMNQGIHSVDMLQWLAGPVRSLYGSARAVLRDIAVEDTAVALLQFQSGAMGTFEITATAYKGKGVRIEIHGELGTLVMEEDRIVSLDILGEEVRLPAFEPFEVIPDGHRLQIRDLAEAIREGRPPIVTGEDGRHSLDIILGTYESSASGKEVALS